MLPGGNQPRRSTEWCSTNTRKEQQMKASIDGTIVADAPDSDLIAIEDNRVGRDYTGYVAFGKNQVTIG